MVSVVVRKEDVVKEVRSVKRAVVRLWVTDLDCYVTVSKKEFADAIEYYAGKRASQWYEVHTSTDRHGGAIRCWVTAVYEVDEAIDPQLSLPFQEGIPY